MAARFMEAAIAGRRDLTDRISEFTLTHADGTPLPPARAGAHVEVRFGGEGRFLRHYSIVGPLTTDGSAEGFWRIAVQRENRQRGSDYIHRNFRPGTKLVISRAQAPFHLDVTDRQVLLVAGGIGITAMLPMLRSCKLRGVDVRMVYAGRSRAAMAFADEVAAIGGPDAVIAAEDEGGRADFRALLADQPEGTAVYVCGPAGMMEALHAAAASLGWAPGRIRHEIFNAAHRPDDQPFIVRTRDGRAVTVGAGTTILDALEAARIDTLSDCRRGECGLCITQLCRKIDIDHRDRFLTDQEKREMDQIALCCSRPVGDVIELDI